MVRRVTIGLALVGASSPRGRLAGLVRACHPYPTAMVVLLTALIGVASGGGTPAGRLGPAVLAMLLSQLAIGWNNDFVDRHRDAVYQPKKPIPAGLVAPALLPPLIAACLAGSAVIGLSLGLTTLALLALGTAAGFAYNLFLKQTPWSWLAYVAGFALLPPFVWSALGVFREEFWWLYPVGAPLAVAAHVANALPDIESDSEAGEGGLVVWLGKGRALALLFTCLVTSPAVIAVSTMWLDYQVATLAPAIAGYAALIAAAAMGYRSGLFRQAASRGFRLVAAACVILATGWLASV